MQFGQIIKISSVNPGKKGEGYKNRGENGKYFHDLILSLAYFCLVNVELIGEHGKIEINGFNGLGSKFIQIVDVVACIFNK